MGQHTLIMTPPTSSEVVASHEGGHALVGFLVGLRPINISLHKAEDDLYEGKTAYEYGSDERYLICEDSAGLTGDDRENCLRFIIKRYMALMGGPHSQARLEKGVRYNRGAVKLITKDLELQKGLCSIYKAYTGQEIDPLRKIEKEAANYVNKYWKAIEELAQSVLISQNLELGKEEIFSILSKFTLP